MMRTLTKYMDMPPVWLLGMLGAAFGLDRVIPGLGFGLDWMSWLGTALAGVGVGTLGLAALQFLRARTTIIPREVPSALLQRGVYRFTRNPIYLADALVLGGLVLRWDVLPALVLVPVFMRVITHRFILGEEDGLRNLFGDEFENWAKKVRRWL